MIIKRIYPTLILLLFFYNSYSQKTITAYIEIRGSVDAMGNITLETPQKPKNLLSAADSLIDYSSIKMAMSKPRFTTPSVIMNVLANEGWYLISVTQVMSDEYKRPTSPFLLYYFKKEFIVKQD